MFFFGPNEWTGFRICTKQSFSMPEHFKGSFPGSKMRNRRKMPLFWSLFKVWACIETIWMVKCWFFFLNHRAQWFCCTEKVYFLLHYMFKGNFSGNNWRKWWNLSFLAFLAYFWPSFDRNRTWGPIFFFGLKKWKLFEMCVKTVISNAPTF